MRWYVDGMNVIGTRPDGWWRDRDAAMLHLVDLLERWAAAEGEDVVVVFERKPSPRSVPPSSRWRTLPGRAGTRPTMRSCGGSDSSPSPPWFGSSPQTGGWPTRPPCSAPACTARTCFAR